MDGKRAQALDLGAHEAFTPAAASGGRTIIGSYLGSAVPARDIPRFVQWWRTGRLPVEQLISGTIALRDINAGMEDLAAGVVLRQIIRFE